MNLNKIKKKKTIETIIDEGMSWRSGSFLKKKPEKESGRDKAVQIFE